MLSKRCLFLICTLLVLAEGYKDYKDYKIYNVIARTADQLEQLQQLSQDQQLDFFMLNRVLNQSSRVSVPPTKSVEFVAHLELHNIFHTLLVDDMSAIIAAERKANQPNTPYAKTSKLNVNERYYRHDEINNHLAALAKLYPSRVFVKSFGRSYERRHLNTITITNGDGRDGKKIIFVDGGMHAREWISPAMTLYIIEQLVENYEENAALLEEFDWVILPVINADGYDYTHVEDRYWRKTRRPSVLEPSCIGTDPNRNFGYEWGHADGASSEPCHELYHGEHAFSEPETQVVRDIMLNYGDRLKYYLTLHSYGNYILLPWGHTSSIPDNFFDMMEVADAGAMAIVRTTGTIYSYGNGYHVIYPTSGDSSDYSVGAVNVSVSMAMELPAGGFSGFDPPVRQIEELVTETWIGVKAMAEVVVDKY